LRLSRLVRRAMVIAGWRKNFEVLADAGVRPCLNCHHTTRHFLVGERKEVRLYFVPVAKFGRKRHLVCEVCSHTTPLSDAETTAIMQGSLGPSSETVSPERVELGTPLPQEGGQPVFGTKKNDLAWAEAAQAGTIKATQTLSEKYESPWTMDHLEAGRRGELLESYYRCMLEAVVAECGGPDASRRATLMKDATIMAEGMRTFVAIRSATARIDTEGIEEPLPQRSCSQP
jgi:hypothetical protein